MRAVLLLLLTSVWVALAVAAPQSDPAVVAGRLKDIDVFRTEFLAKDRSYVPAARAEAEARLNQLARKADELSQAYFELEISRIVSLADNGHTAFFPGPRSRRYNRVEIRLVPFGEEFFVLRAKAANADLLGARLIAIDGKPMAAYRDVARTLQGGLPAWRDRNAGYFFESPEQMQALGLLGQSDAATYRFQTRTGSTVERRLAAEPANPNRPRANADRWLFPEAMPAENGAWMSPLALARAPWSLTEPDAAFRWRWAAEINAPVIDFRQNNDSEKRPIASFLAEAEAMLKARRPQHVVLDMRLNGGGDLNTTRDFMQALPKLVPGRILVLTSPWTFSAAISSVGYVRQAAGARVTIIGEAVGDRLNFFSEGSVVELPHSKIEMLNATERHDYATGCRGLSDCHEPVVRHPISVATLAPDISAPWTIDAFLNGRDPGMEAAAAALR
ncbi:MAG: hypothetical protein KBA31_18565 [Alphaproteobacteria bacterium]|nr:hypothetical protein [Alphaproteobacteria bacterium]